MVNLNYTPGQSSCGQLHQRSTIKDGVSKIVGETTLCSQEGLSNDQLQESIPRHLGRLGTVLFEVLWVEGNRSMQLLVIGNLSPYIPVNLDVILGNQTCLLYTSPSPRD